MSEIVKTLVLKGQDFLSHFCQYTYVASDMMWVLPKALRSVGNRKKETADFGP